MKRILDIAFSLVGIVVMAPVCLVVALGILLTSSGPVIFRQQRLGRGGRTFWILKFRTMVIDRLDQGCNVTEAGNDRITPFGTWLRRTKLDEIPQLLNVLRGDMSFVGPRPEVAEFANLFPQQYDRILKVRPGITHSATIKFRREEEILAAVDDPCRYYVERVMPVKLAAYEANLESSLAHDIQTIVQTIIPQLGELPWEPEYFGSANPVWQAPLDSPKIENIPVFAAEIEAGGESVDPYLILDNSRANVSV
ncbi:MAG: lipopolysaccharide/colanic/teichoic acid biosynthesis glycosyltransferase [Candidatus Krumholzibacteriia bacterium]